LKGHVEHSNRLEPTPPLLKTGIRYDEVNLKALTPNNIWYRIPNWLGGRWKIERLTAYYRYAYKSGVRALTTDTFTNRTTGDNGWQKDSTGQVWNFQHVPFTTKVYGDDDYMVAVVKDWEPLEVTSQKAVIRTVELRINANKQSNVITSIQQGETVHTYFPVGTNLLKEISSIKIFDETGQPLILQEGVAFLQRISPYRSVDYYDGKDMRAIFREYLENHGLAGLLSASVATQSVRESMANRSTKR